MRRDSRLQTIIDALQKMSSAGSPAVRIWGRAPGSGTDGAEGNVWAGDVYDVARHIHTRLYGRPSTEAAAAAAPGSSAPLLQADIAKRAGDVAGEIDALMSGARALHTAPWYPAQAGDLVHIHYEASPHAAPPVPAVGETYELLPCEGGLQLRMLHHTAPEHERDLVGWFSPGAPDDPLREVWMEAGPQRLTIVRDGRVVHDGPGARRQADAESAVADAARYLERGEPALALARLRSPGPLPACGLPGPLLDHDPCARPAGHDGAHSPDADHTDPPHECLPLPEELHAAVLLTTGGVGLAGLWEDRGVALGAAEDLAHEHGADLVEARPSDGSLMARIDGDRPVAAAVRLPLLPDPRIADEYAAEGAEPDPDYGKDLGDYDGDGGR